MASNITIQIPYPVLTAGQHFKVSYKPSGSSIWFPLPNQTNASFQITNLNDGNYDISYTMVLADATECGERIDHFQVFTKVCPCIIDVTGAVVELSANNYQIEISFTNVLNQPPCGWVVDYKDDSGVDQTVYYQTIAPPLVIPVPRNSAYYVRIWANCCGQNQLVCATLDIPAASGSSCQPSVYNDDEFQLIIGGSQAQGYYLQIHGAQQSIPITNSFVVNFNQVHANFAFPAEIGSTTVSPTYGALGEFYLTIPINPEPHNPLQYFASVMDVCGNWIPVFKTP